MTHRDGQVSKWRKRRFPRHRSCLIKQQVKLYLSGPWIAVWDRRTITVGHKQVDKIEEIVDKAIQYTEDILQRSPRHYPVAREGLERMRNNLAIGAEDHPALHKLDEYLEELRRRYSN